MGKSHQIPSLEVPKAAHEMGSSLSPFQAIHSGILGFSDPFSTFSPLLIFPEVPWGRHSMESWNEPSGQVVPVTLPGMEIPNFPVPAAAGRTGSPQLYFSQHFSWFVLPFFFGHFLLPSNLPIPFFPSSFSCKFPALQALLFSQLWEFSLELGSFGFLSGAGSRAAAPPFPGKGCGRISAFSVSFPRGKTLDLGIQDLLEPGIPVPSLCQQSSEMGKVELKIQV